MRYIFTVCGDVSHERAAGERFDDLPADWVCPVCGVGKDEFAPE